MTLSFSLDKSIPIIEDFEKACEIAQAYQKPLVLLFLGSDPCCTSREFVCNVLENKEFIRNCCQDFLFVRVNFPELQHPSSHLWEENHKLKKKFQVASLPTMILLDSQGEEVTKFAYFPCSGKDYARHLRYLFREYKKLLRYIESSHFSTATSHELKSLYFRSRDLRCTLLMQKILQEGAMRKEDLFFLVELYSNLSNSGKKESEDAKKIRNTIQKKDPFDSQGALLRLALLDFQEEVSKEEGDPKVAIQPVINYLDSPFSERNKEVWRIYRMTAEYLFNHDLAESSLQILNRGKKYFPGESLVEVEQFERVVKDYLLSDRVK